MQMMAPLMQERQNGKSAFDGDDRRIWSVAARPAIPGSVAVEDEQWSLDRVSFGQGSIQLLELLPSFD